MRAGVIVAGGHSIRFGTRDKVLADFAGVPMVRRVTDRLAGIVDELVVNCRAEQVEAIETALSGIDARFVTDPVPDLGPLAGIHTGLTAAESEYAAVVAADMPLVSPAFISYLFDRAAGRDAAVPRFDGKLQPTQTVYRTEAMADACATALERGDRRLRVALSALDYAVVEETEAREHTDMETFTNVNTREEYEAVVEKLAATEATDIGLTNSNVDTKER